MQTFCVFLVLGLFVAGAFGDDAVCTEQSLCKCVTDKGTIDLNPLASKVFHCNDKDGANEYSYSPCAENKTAPCLDAMLCKRTLTGSVSLGKSSGEKFIKRDDGIAIEYLGDDNKTSVVMLTCKQGTEGDLSLKSDNGTYVFELESQYACVGGPGSSTSKKPTTKTTKTTPKSKTTKTTPKSTKTTPKTTSKTTKTTPKTTKTTPKGTKTTPKGTKTTPKGTKTTPKGTKTTPKGTKTTPKGTKTTPKGTKTTPKMQTTTHHGGAASHCSISMAALSVLVLVFRQLI